MKRIDAHQATSERGAPSAARAQRARNYDEVVDLVTDKIAKSAGRISAKRLLPLARAAGYAGSDSNFPRLVAEVRLAWRQGQGPGRRAAPGGVDTG